MKQINPSFVTPFEFTPLRYATRRWRQDLPSDVICLNVRYSPKQIESRTENDTLNVCYLTPFIYIICKLIPYKDKIGYAVLFSLATSFGYEYECEHIGCDLQKP